MTILPPLPPPVNGCGPDCGENLLVSTCADGIFRRAASALAARLLRAQHDPLVCGINYAHEAPNCPGCLAEGGQR
jgi:hypothetical protein